MANRSDAAGQGAMPKEDCAALADLLAVYADGGLSGADAQRFDRHLALCPACKMEVADFRVVLSALRAAPALSFDRTEAAIPHHDDTFWRTLAADIDSATRTGEAPLRHDATDDSWTQVSHIVTMRRRRFWQVSAVAGGALAAAAAVLLMIAPVPHGSTHEAQAVKVAERTANWFEVPALQIDEDLGTSEGDPLETLDDLDDNELELVDSELGNGV